MEALDKPIQKYDLPFQDARMGLALVKPVRTVDFRKFLFVTRLCGH